MSSAISAQVVVREDAIFAHVAKTPATVSVGLTNSSAESLEAVLTLEWIPPEGKPDVTTRRTIEVKPGELNFDIPLPLPAPRNPLTERLRYQVSPSARNFTAFRPQRGMLSLPEIANNAFTLSIVTADVPRLGKPYPVYVLAAHAVTHRPVAGVAIRCGETSAVTGVDGTATLQIQLHESEEQDSLTVEGKLGDYMQTRDIPLMPRSDTVNIYTDKPLYQPGQTMHMRMLAFSSGGPVQAYLKHEIRVLDERQDVLFDTNVSTSRFGIASIDWSIPENTRSGNYTIEVERDGLDPTVHEIEIRRYELPSFAVSAKPEHAFYLSGQKATIDVAAEYLFGKPVESGAARISAEDSDQTIAAGELKDGHFKATVDTDEVPEQIQFSDRHFIAYVTDRSTNRTEQRKFDLRVSRFPINLYVAKYEQTQHEDVVYLSAYLPDGEPVRATISVVADGKKLAGGETNRYGLARLTFARGDYEDLSVHAAATEGSAEQPLSVPIDTDSRLWLATDHILYRSGESVRCHITSAVKDGRVLLFAWNTNGQTVLSKELTLKDGSADLEIPYQARFRSQISIGVASAAVNSSAAQTVVFAGGNDFTVRATPAQATYHPGDLARINFQTSGAAALGVAVVDESVLERAQTDAITRRWFYDSGEPEIAGIRLRDLASLDPARINDDLQLVAAVLIPPADFGVDGGDFETEIEDAFRQSEARSIGYLKNALDQHYADTLEFPRNQQELLSILGDQYTSLHDPWMEPFYSQFAIEGPVYVLRLMSSGPDKKRETADDFVALEVRRNWFTPYEALIAQQLKPLRDYPATADQFKALVHKAGIDFYALHDPWGSGLRVVVTHQQQRRVIRILSAGPDARWDTPDDFVVAQFSGYYFRSAELSIQHAIFARSGFPKDEANFRARLRDGGIAFDTLRDPWGRPYYVAFSTEDSWGDDVEIYSYAEYPHPSEGKKVITPVKRHIRVLQIRSVGADGIRGTYDDFSVAEFRRVAQIEKATAPEQLGKLPPGHVAGTGTIRGEVRDQTGAAIPNAHIVLNGLYDSETNQNGEYEFSAIPPGIYELRAEAEGFQRYQLTTLPVEADRISQANVVLVIASVSQSVQLAASHTQIQTQSAELAPAGQRISTPRVREYFPETLYWAPELITGKDGRASVQVKLADSVTTWHIAVLASTVDGEISESDTKIRAFQPLLADLSVPQVLTAGDSVSIPVPIRNYTGQAQSLTVSSKLAESLGSGQIAPERLTIPASSSNEAILSLHAASSVEHASVQVNVIGRNASDAIKKTIDIHPDGEQHETVVNGFAAAEQPLQMKIPSAVIPDSIQAQVTIFPSLLSRILASVRALLTRPYGCAEQTISASYTNLLFLRALRQTRLDGRDLPARAEKNLQDGYKRLLNYQDIDGAFSYWGKQDRADAALTAYAVQFLQDAQEFIHIDPERLKRARKWLGSHVPDDASSQALRLHSLLQSGSVPDGDEQLGQMARTAAEWNDPYAIAQFALAAMKAGKTDLARRAVADLQKIAKDEQGTAFWDIRTDTPFHGWGRAGQIETTAVVLEALAQWRKINGNDSELNTAIDRGLLFLFRNAGPDGAWPTTQATVQVLDAMLSVWEGIDRRERTAMTLSVNDQPAKHFVLDSAGSVQSPITIDISRFVRLGAANQISFSGGDSAIQVQAAASWYAPWSKPETAKTLQFAASCSPGTLDINQLSQCHVRAGRTSFREYGMLIASIGLPPGAEVDRGSLTALVENGTIDSFEIAPDHVVIYLWPQAAAVHFRFGFRPQFAMRAKAAQSMLYDYYNPDEKVVLQSIEYQVK